MNNVGSRDGTTIAFDRSGKGPPVILVGGAQVAPEVLASALREFFAKGVKP